MTSITRGQYRDAFKKEVGVEYPVIDAIEREFGYSIDHKRLWEAASVMACPVKVNPPNWQHGRVIYAVLRRYLRLDPLEPVVCLDVGTAKGFSALCAAWAIDDSRVSGRVWSVDVIDPAAVVERNSIRDVDGPTSVHELLRSWPQHAPIIKLERSTGVAWLGRSKNRVHFAFVDGKHAYEAVSAELALLSQRQRPGDYALIDDMQITGVERAVAERRDYDIRVINVLSKIRRYALLRRK